MMGKYKFTMRNLNEQNQYDILYPEILLDNIIDFP